MHTIYTFSPHLHSCSSIACEFLIKIKTMILIGLWMFVRLHQHQKNVIYLDINCLIVFFLQFCRVFTSWIWFSAWNQMLRLMPKGYTLPTKFILKSLLNYMMNCNWFSVFIIFWSQIHFYSKAIESNYLAEILYIFCKMLC